MTKMPVRSQISQFISAILGPNIMPGKIALYIYLLECTMGLRGKKVYVLWDLKKSTNILNTVGNTTKKKSVQKYI